MGNALQLMVLLGGLVHGSYLAGDAVKLRPYVPPVLEPEPPYAPSDVRVVEIQPSPGFFEAPVRVRPTFSAPVLGHVVEGARFAVRGELQVDNTRGCPSGYYYAIAPFGWLCADYARATSEPPTATPSFTADPETSLPFRYVTVRLKEGTYLPMWASLEALGGEPERLLSRGDSVAIRERIEVEGKAYWVTQDEKVVPVDGTAMVGRRSEWHGVQLTPETPLPFGWITRNKARVLDAPGGETVERLARRTRVDLLETQEVGRKRWLRIGEARWIDADHVGEVRRLPRPESAQGNSQWIDVDLGEQVVVAYRGEQPVYATLISSGRTPNNTPMGDYPIWAKVTSITMKSQQYDDHPYYVDKVPWVLFFQAHNALHGAYWHDGFGMPKSHGCANLSPADAHYLFQWLSPGLPPGFSAVRYWDLTAAPLVHVHNSQLRRDFVQERNIGPPDPTEEAARLEAAEERRAAEGSDVVIDPNEGL